MQNLRRIFELIIEKYYPYKSVLFIACVLILSLIIICSILLLTGQRRYAINKLLHKSLYATGIAWAGNFLYLMGIQLKIDYRYFNAMVFTIVGGFLFLCGCIQCIIFRNRFEPAMQFFKHFQYALFLELLLLAITDRLEIAEGIVCIISIDAIEMILLLFEKWQKKQEKKQNNNHTKESDFPNIDLFPTRCRQLDCFIPILKQQKDEPYSLMISAEWGMGKSSFVKALALDYRMSKDHFVWIMAGSEKSVSEIMLEISEQIIKILRENNIFIEKEHSIENYFLAFSGLLEEAGVELWGKVSHMLGIGSERNARNQQYLNNKLKKLNSTICGNK